MWKKGQDDKAFKYSWVKAVRVLVEGKVIKMEQGPRLVVDGQIVSQYIDSFKLRVIQINQKIQLKTLSGLEVTWDGSDRVSVTVPNEARNKTCGLCGNYDGKRGNDWIIGPACPDKAGRKTDNYDLFGRSWVLPDVCPVNCDNEEPPPPPEDCESAPKADVIQACNTLVDKQASVFKKCLDAKDSAYLEDLKFSCVFDLCASDEDLDVKICRLAETIAKDCAEVEKIRISNWRKSVDSCPDKECPPGQTYSDCGPANPPNCFTDGTDPSITVCEEGCFCPEGLLLEDDKCITKEQCGCYHDNSYIPTGQSVILGDCRAEVTCEGKNDTTSKPVECGLNEECKNEDGVTGCFCIEGYSLVNGTCEDASCVGLACPENMECSNGTCVCVDGYIEECGFCVDLDECKTHLHSCHGRGQKCVNVPGTYRCDCAPGFTHDGKTCKDVNECEVMPDICADHSECVNTPGGYVCECCAGYKHASNGNCVRDPSKETASGNRCCACRGVDCIKPGKVCGTDGNTYNSYRDLSVHACKTQDDSLVFNYKGHCESSCDDIVCNKPYQTCKKEKGIASCNCPNCGNSPAHAQPVCGTDGVTYPGVCALKKFACENDLEDVVAVKSHDPCPGDGQS
ncbi:hypothetical protein EGW08_007573 [Elysia chlorotica]|uniref:VWFD domain-containing protein n=1 Tax=Elysia chlorotica TaxID=188477 RepID=A0A433TSQ9_ELYCH|nr:hypothetical protein EGW08_007573 [Elysia chlorotica]